MDGSLGSRTEECRSGLTLVLGPPNSGKMGYALDWWSQRLSQSPLVVAPTTPVAWELTREMIGRVGALFGQEPAVTFDGLVGSIDGRYVRRPSQFEHRLLVARLLQEVPLGPLRETAPLPGTGAALSRLLQQFGESGKDPAELDKILGLWMRAHTSAAGLGADVLSLYRTYLETMTALGMSDGSTAAREAMDLIGGWTRPVVLYGFTSFTGVQQNLIEALSKEAPVLMALSYDANRPVNISTQAEVEGWSKKAAHVVELLPRVRAYSSPAIAYLEDHFMCDRPAPEPPRPEAGPEGVRFLLSSGQRNEAELVAEHVSALLREGFEPGDIAVLVRRLRSWSSLLRQVFGSCGIPYHIDDVLTLGQTGLGHALLNGLRGLMRNDAESFLSYLRSPYSGLVAETVADLELEYRRGGRRGARALADSVENTCPGEFESLHAVIGGHPGVPFVDVDGLEETAQRMLSASARHGTVVGGDFEEDVRAFRTLCEVASVIRVSAAARPAGGQLEVEALLQILAGIPIPGSRIGTTDAVQILDVQRARARRFAVVVILGLVEGEFPGHSEPPSLFSRDQRNRLDALAGGGLFLPEANQEAALFMSAISRAWQLLFLSARDADDGGGEVMPSRFWSLSRTLLGDKGSCETRTLAEVVFGAEKAPSLRHYRRACAARGLVPHPSVCPGGSGERTRPWRRPPPRLTDSVVLAELEGTQSFSPSSLEKYLSCPFSWFVERVVGIEELEPELDARSTGQLLHSALSTTYGELASRGSLPVGPENLAGAEHLACAVVERLVERDGCPGSPAEKRLTTWRLKKMMRRLLEMESEAASTLATLETESEVGGEDGVDIGGLKVRGRIDRIDADGARRSLFVVDYKSGAVPDPSSLGSVRALQLPLYLMALAAERPSAEVIGGAYLSPREGRGSGLVRSGSERLIGSYGRGCRVLDPEAMEGLLAEARAVSCEAVEGIRSGAIAPQPEQECPWWCGLGPVCRARRGGYRP